MKRLTFLLFSLFISISILPQIYMRNVDESAEDFINRIKPSGKELVHPVIETTWNSPAGQKVIFAFWEVKGTKKADYVMGKLLVPIDEEENYKMITIDKFYQNPSTPQILSVFFVDHDKDGIYELGVLYSSDYRHYIMAGTFYNAAVYQAIDYDNLPNELFCIEDIDGGTDGNNDVGEEFSPIFTTTAEAKKYLKERGPAKKEKLNFIKNFEGTIGEEFVYLHLKKRSGELEGFYFSKKQGEDIMVRGSIDGSDGTINLGAWNQEEGYTIQIKGQIKGESFSGGWTDRRTNEKKPVKLKESKVELTPSDEIVGIYTTESEWDDLADLCDCPMRLKIEEEAGKYIYTLRISQIQYRGDVSLSREIDHDNDETIYITLDGIPWAEWLGNIAHIEDEEDMPELMEISGVDGVWDSNRNSIMIQNTGNAMNYYVKLKECDCKYIYLSRKD